MLASGGLLKMVLEDPQTKKRTVVFGDNGPTVRALMGVFGPHIVRNHTVLVDQLVGQEIGYETADWMPGFLESISE